MQYPNIILSKEIDDVVRCHFNKTFDNGVRLKQAKYDASVHVLIVGSVNKDKCWFPWMTDNKKDRGTNFDSQ